MQSSARREQSQPSPGDKRRARTVAHTSPRQPQPRRLTGARQFQLECPRHALGIVQLGQPVEEFLRAVEAASNRANPNFEPLIAFITETLGEPWEDFQMPNGSCANPKPPAKPAAASGARQIKKGSKGQISSTDERRVPR